MREIKFRAWDSNEGRMWSHAEIDASDKDGIVMWGEIFNKKEGGFAVMQFTGIRDVTGKEIYEGDIVRLTYIKDEGKGWRSNSKEQGVVYFDPHWGVKFDCKDLTQRTAETHWKVKGGQFRDACDVEVIGNIYEHSHLLDA